MHHDHVYDHIYHHDRVHDRIHHYDRNHDHIDHHALSMIMMIDLSSIVGSQLVLPWKLFHPEIEKFFIWRRIKRFFMWAGWKGRCCKDLFLHFHCTQLIASFPLSSPPWYGPPASQPSSPSKSPLPPPSSPSSWPPWYGSPRPLNPSKLLLWTHYCVPQLGLVVNIKIIIILSRLYDYCVTQLGPLVMI